MSRWDGIEEFLAAYEHRRFSAAADALRMSTSHVSRAVARLEQRLGARLFLRTTRTVTPTDLAHGFAERCRRMIEDREEALAAIAGRGPPQGRLRITCSVAFGEIYVAPLLRRFIGLHPHVEAELDLDNRVMDLFAGNYDLAIRTGYLADSRLIGTRIAARHLHVCAAPAYIEKHGAPRSVDELERHDCIRGTSDHWVFEVNGAALEIRPKGRWRCNSGFAVRDAALEGIGICQLPDYYVRDHMAAGTLAPLLEHCAAPQQPVWAVYPHRHHLQPKVRLFIDMMRETLAATG